MDHIWQGISWRRREALRRSGCEGGEGDAAERVIPPRRNALGLI